MYKTRDKNPSRQSIRMKYNALRYFDMLLWAFIPNRISDVGISFIGLINSSIEMSDRELSRLKDVEREKNTRISDLNHFYLYSEIWFHDDKVINMQVKVSVFYWLLLALKVKCRKF